MKTEEMNLLIILKNIWDKLPSRVQRDLISGAIATLKQHMDKMNQQDADREAME